MALSPYEEYTFTLRHRELMDALGALTKRVATLEEQVFGLIVHYPDNYPEEGTTTEYTLDIDASDVIGPDVVTSSIPWPPHTRFEPDTK